MIVAFIGSDHFKWGKKIMKQSSKKITKLVKKDGARIFLFTGEGDFDLLCWIIVTGLKTRYSDIKRVFAQRKEEDNDHDRKVVDFMYEQTFLLDAVRDAGFWAPSVRNEAMLEMCDVLVTNCDLGNGQMPRIKSEAEMAVEYAQEKRVINLFSKLY